MPKITGGKGRDLGGPNDDDGKKPDPCNNPKFGKNIRKQIRFLTSEASAFLKEAERLSVEHADVLEETDPTLGDADVADIDEADDSGNDEEPPAPSSRLGRSR